MLNLLSSNFNEGGGGGGGGGTWPEHDLYFFQRRPQSYATFTVVHADMQAVFVF